MKTRHIFIQHEMLIPILFLFFTSIFIGCISSNEHSFSIPFWYPSMGIGDQPVSSTVVLKKGSEQKMISRAIINALQSESFSIVKPKLAPGEALPTRERIDTDEVPLSREWWLEHNAHNREELHLPTHPNYCFRLRYCLRYDIGDKELYFKINAILQQKARYGHKWREYKEPYSGAFFVRKLEDRIRAALANGETKDGEFLE